MFLSLCYKEDALLNGFLVDDARPLKNFLGVMITDVSGHYNSGDKFTIDDKESGIINGTVYPVTYTELVLGLKCMGFEIEGADDFNEICKNSLSDKVALGRVTYGTEKEKVMVKSDR